MTDPTGGPAFPVPHEPNVHGTAPGMDLRDYFAIHSSIIETQNEDGNIPDAVAAALMRGPAPKWQDDMLAAFAWWAEAEARLRYIKADAMLRARRVSP